MPLDILPEPLTLGAKWSNLRSKHLMATGSFMTLLRLNASFAMMPRGSSCSHQNSNRVLRSKPKNRLVGGFEAQTTKPHGEAYPLHLLYDLDTCHHRPRPPDHQVLLRLRLTWSTLSTPAHVLLLVDGPQVLATTVILPAILVPWSKPHICPLPLPVHRHDMFLLDILHVHRSFLCSTLAHQYSQETCCTRTHAMVSFQTQRKPIISRQSFDTQGHISILCSQLIVRLVLQYNILLIYSINNMTVGSIVGYYYLSGSLEAEPSWAGLDLAECSNAAFPLRMSD
jgi:hypothetical protein